MSALDQIKALQNQIQASIIGQSDVINKILIGLLTDGNVLLEGLPGLAKTRAIKSPRTEPRLQTQSYSVHA